DDLKVADRLHALRSLWRVRRPVQQPSLDPRSGAREFSFFSWLTERRLPKARIYFVLRLLGRLPQTVMTEVSEKLRRVGDLQLLERWTQPTALNFAHAKLTIFPISPHNFADDGTFLRNLVDRARAQPKSFAA